MKIDTPLIKKKSEFPKTQAAKLKFHVLCMSLLKYLSSVFR